MCPVLAYNACKRLPRGSLRGGRADRNQIWFRFSRDQRWRPSWFADTARGHGRASRGEKRQRSSGHRSESVLPIRRLLSPKPLDVWGRQGARCAVRVRTPGDRRAPLAGGRHPPPRADRTAVRETLGSLQDGAWPNAGSGSPGRSSGDDAPPLRVGHRTAGCSSRLGEGLRGPEANSSASDRRAAQGVSPQGTRSRLVFVIAGGAATLRAGPRLARPSRSLSRATRSESPSSLSVPSLARPVPRSSE